MRKMLLICLGLSLAACTEYPGAKTNCWSKAGSTSGNAKGAVTRSAYSPSLSFAATTPDAECSFEPLD